MKVQLLHETTDPEPFIADPAFAAQQKLNGERRLIVKRGGEVCAYSRNGRARNIAATILDAARGVAGDFIADGELVGETFTAFDVQQLDGADVCALPQWRRFAMLTELPFAVVRHAIGSDAKAALLRAVRDENGEGLVFKRLCAPYRDGRSVDCVKFKFWQSENFVITAVDPRGSIHLQYQGRDCGKCPFDLFGGMPAIGSVAEIRFSAWTARGKLVHPKFLGFRHDQVAA